MGRKADNRSKRSARLLIKSVITYLIDPSPSRRSPQHRLMMSLESGRRSIKHFVQSDHQVITVGRICLPGKSPDSSRFELTVRFCYVNNVVVGALHGTPCSGFLGLTADYQHTSNTILNEQSSLILIYTMVRYYSICLPAT